MNDAAQCLACGSEDLEHWARAHDVEYRSVPESFSYLRCRSCQALSIHPVPANRLSVIYPSNYYSFQGTGRSFADRVKRRLDRRYFRALLRRLPGQQLSALDVGGGAGHQLSVLRAADSRVARTTVVDFDDGAKALAEGAGHEFVHGRIEDVKISGPYDVVLLLNLIEHVAEPLSVLRRVREVLTPTAIAVVQTPNYDSLDAKLFRHRGWGGYHCPRHWVIFTPSSFAGIVSRAGLVTRRWHYTQGAPFWTVSMLAALERAGLTRITPERPAWLHPLYPSLAAGFAAIDFTRGLLSPLSQMVFVLGRD